MGTGFISGLEEREAELRRQRRLYLMRWNPNISSYSRDMFDSDFEKFRQGKSVDDANWTIRDWKEVQDLDMFLLAQVGTDNDGIVAGGYIESEPYTYTYEDGHVGKTRFVDILFLFMQKIEKRHLLSAEELSKAVPEIDWHKGHSGVLIPVDIAERLSLYMCNKLVRVQEDENLVFEEFSQKHYVLCDFMSLLCPVLKNKLSQEGRYRSETAPDHDILDVNVGYAEEELKESTQLEDIAFLEMGGRRM